MHADRDDRREWLEADGLGGFASGTISGIRTRRYHAVLLSAATPPTGRQVFVAGLEADVTAGDSTWAISSQRYAPDVIHPDGITRLESFAIDPWPQWTFRLRDGLTIEQSLFVPRGLPGGTAIAGLRNISIRLWLSGPKKGWVAKNSCKLVITRV